ncbi:hypothetical protein NADE_008402 [Nannochloris sp. 'desiccata']|nr:hypothetical protein KSW81_000285 [Chlorella desiccata (nom. nud.)]KAH7620128.1 hypothetical protein NADE_008402 [Chlorella desiccata (nom. nud.)]
MLVATSINLPKSGSIQQSTLKPSSRKTQRFASIVPCAFIGQNQSNASDTSETTKLRRAGDSSHAMTTAAEKKHQQHSSKASEKSRVAPKAIEGTNLFSMDDDYAYITVEDLLTA